MQAHEGLSRRERSRAQALTTKAGVGRFHSLDSRTRALAGAPHVGTNGLTDHP